MQISPEAFGTVGIMFYTFSPIYPIERELIYLSSVKMKRARAISRTDSCLYEALLSADFQFLCYFLADVLCASEVERGRNGS